MVVECYWWWSAVGVIMRSLQQHHLIPLKWCCSHRHSSSRSSSDGASGCHLPCCVSATLPSCLQCGSLDTCLPQAPHLDVSCRHVECCCRPQCPAVCYRCRNWPCCAKECSRCGLVQYGCRCAQHHASWPLPQQISSTAQIRLMLPSLSGRQWWMMLHL